MEENETSTYDAGSTSAVYKNFLAESPFTKLANPLNKYDLESVSANFVPSFCFYKPKDLRKSLKYLGMPNEALNSYFKAMEDSDISTYDTRSMSTVFMKFFSNLAECLLTKLPNPPDGYNLESVLNYYSSFTITNDFCLNITSEDKVLKIIKKSKFLTLSA